MECFNCGNDADMEVYMMVNGKMKKLNICMDCYREQMQNMMESVQDEDGNINPDEIQKQMFNFFQKNRGEFEKFFGSAVGDENFSMDDLSPDNFNITEMNLGNTGFDLNSQDMNQMFKDLSKKLSDNIEKMDKNPFSNFSSRKSYGPGDREKNLSHKDKEIIVLKNAAKRKRAELNQHIQMEDYLAAANSRDEMREINKKIMIIKRLAKEGEK